MSIPNKTLKFDDKDLLLGSRYLIKNSKFVDIAEKIKVLNAELGKNNIASIALVPNALYEDVLTYHSLGFANMFLIRYDESPFAMYETIKTFIEHINRLQEQGIKVAVFVEDITTLANAVDYAFKNNTKALMGHTETAVETIKQIMLLAKAGENDKHTTLFTTFDEADMIDQLYVSSVYKIAKKLEF